MHINLKQKPKSPVIIEGFPGFGMVSTIATEFLVEHLNAKSIGKIWSEKLMPLVAIHKNKILQPLEIYYDKKDNIVILHALSNVNGLEWEISDMIVELARQLKAKEIISLEGVGSADPKSNNAFYYSRNDKQSKSLEKIGLKPLNEGIIIGVTGALLLKSEKLPVSCIFAETHSKLPDSKAAAKIIETLDKYLGLKVDYRPLIKTAEKFEAKLKGLMKGGKEAQTLKEAKELSYLG
ncbi:hypothetical protein CL621_00260 [archaeon]|nr:hypothetical protein [archaeon]